MQGDVGEHSCASHPAPLESAPLQRPLKTPNFMNTQQTAIADSSPVRQEIPTDSDARAEWLQTGKLPEVKPPKTEEAAASPADKQDSAPADDKQQDSSADEAKKPAAETASDSEPDKKQESKRSNADNRLREILADLKAAGLSPSELKTFKRQTAQAETKQAEPSPAKPDEYKPLTEDDYFAKNPTAQYGDYIRAAAKHEAKWEAQQAIKEERQRMAQEAATRDFQTKVTDARTRLKDFDTIAVPVADAIWTDQGIPQLVKDFFSDSDLAMDVLHAIGASDGALDDFVQTAKANAMAGLRKALAIEALIRDQYAKGKKTETDTPAKKVTSAPPPPSEVGGKGTAPEDDVADAVRRGDFRSYMAKQNARDEARLKKG